MPCLACAFGAVTNAREGSRPVRSFALANMPAAISLRMTL